MLTATSLVDRCGDRNLEKFVAIISSASRLGAPAIARSLARSLGDQVCLELIVVSSSDEATAAARVASSST